MFLVLCISSHTNIIDSSQVFGVDSAFKIDIRLLTKQIERDYDMDNVCLKDSQRQFATS